VKGYDFLDLLTSHLEVEGLGVRGDIRNRLILFLDP